MREKGRKAGKDGRHSTVMGHCHCDGHCFTTSHKEASDERAQLSKNSLDRLCGESILWREEAIEEAGCLAFSCLLFPLAPLGSCSRSQIPCLGMWVLVPGHACLHGSVLPWRPLRWSKWLMIWEPGEARRSWCVW